MKKNEALLWNLRNEYERQDRSGIYGYTQRTLAYNSNRIEGSTLTETQTAALFEEGYLPASDEIYRRKDIEEMNGHFLMFNRMLATIEEPLSERLIKSFHYELKAGVFEDRANGYAIGEYKQWRNTVGGMTLASPDEVQGKMSDLLLWYADQSIVSLETIARLHAQYELIHPFQDGNGRTGRMILFRECLKYDIEPFIIQNENRAVYIAALNRVQTKDDYDELEVLFEQEQSRYKEQCEFFNVEERYLCFCKSNIVKTEDIEQNIDIEERSPSL